jgi:signal transduction histidine kinase
MKQLSHPTVPAPGSNTLRRWVNFWNFMSLAMALFAAVYALVDQPNTLPTILLIIGFAFLYLLWYWFFIVHLDRWGRDSLVLALSFAVIMLVLGGMTKIHTIYYMQLFSFYGIIFSVMEIRLAIPLSIFLSGFGVYLIILRNRMTLPEGTGLLIGFGIATFFAIVMGLFISAIIRQSAERQKIIDELNAARAELARAEREAGILEERQRLSREIHDTLAQGFTSIVTHLEAADQALPTDPALDKVRQHIDKARGAARESLGEARRFVWALRSESLERESLVQVVRQVADRWAEETGLSAQVDISGPARQLPSAYEVTLLRMLQEALVNVRKHAAARQVAITLTYMDDQVILDVQDDGQGFVPVQSGPAGDGGVGEARAEGGRAEGGLGLIGMRERAEQLGGSLIIESEPGEGTTLVLVLPLAPSTRQDSEVG